MWGFIRRPAGRAAAAGAAAALVVGVLSGCGGGGSAVQVGEVPVAATSASPSGTAASALDGLRGFLAEAERLDARVRQTAGMINADITAAGVRPGPATRAAIDALDTGPLARALPAGMNPQLTGAALLVLSNLTSRVASFNGVPDGYEAAGSTGYRRMVACLANGSRAVARYQADVAALRRLAEASPVFTVAGTSSRAAAEIAVRAAMIRGGNNCCDTCGGYVSAKVLPVAWTSSEARARLADRVVDGQVDGIDFESSYREGAGWTIELHAG